LIGDHELTGKSKEEEHESANELSAGCYHVPFKATEALLGFRSRYVII
jgi:hypothetical protein